MELIALIVAGVALVAALYLAYMVWQQKILIREFQDKQHTLFEGRGAKDLESVLMRLAEKAQQQDGQHRDIVKELEHLRAAFNTSLSRVGVVRYNPFQNTGSDQSFSVALLNAHKNGVVLTGIFTREGTSIYAKPIANGMSKYQLTEEEQQALNSAK